MQEHICEEKEGPHLQSLPAHLLQLPLLDELAGGSQHVRGVAIDLIQNFDHFVEVVYHFEILVHIIRNLATIKMMLHLLGRNITMK